jgi:hypothetical protein
MFMSRVIEMSVFGQRILVHVLVLVKERSLEHHCIRKDVFVLLQPKIDDLLGVVAVQSPGFKCRHDANDLRLVANECLVFTCAYDVVNLMVLLLLP